MLAVAVGAIAVISEIAPNKNIGAVEDIKVFHNQIPVSCKVTTYFQESLCQEAHFMDSDVFSGTIQGDDTFGIPGFTLLRRIGNHRIP